MNRDGMEQTSELPAKLKELSWWTLKWLIAAAILVGASQIYFRLDRQNILVDAIINNIQEQSKAK